MSSNTQTKLKILFITSDKYPPYRVDVSVLFGKEIVGRGHIIDAIFQSEKPNRSAYRTQWSGCVVMVGPAHRRTSMRGRLIDYLYSILHDFRMLRILKTPGYDYILVKDKFISGLTGILASKLYSVSFIYWLSFPFPEDWLSQADEHITRFPWLYRIRGNVAKFILYKILLRLCDHAFVQTEEMRKGIAQKDIPKEKMTAVPMAVSIKDIPFFSYEPKHSYKQEKKVVYLGTLMRVRRMDFLLRSFKKVLEKQKHARLYFVGGSENPTDEKYLEIEAKKLQIDYAVKITGTLPQVKAWQHVKDADVCVSPIYPSPIFNCGSPTKLIEYMAMGKAVVANDHPEQRIVIFESKAGICVPYEEDAFAGAILYLLKNPDVAKQMGIRGRRYIEKNRNYEQTADLVERKLFELSKITRPS